MRNWQYCKCGHEYTRHYKIGPNSKYMFHSDGTWTPVQCTYGKYPEDNEGPRCTCPEFQFDHESGIAPWEMNK